MLRTPDTRLAFLVAVKAGHCNFFHFGVFQFEILDVVAVCCDC